MSVKKVHDLKLTHKFAITVDNVFTKEECQKLIVLAEDNKAFKKATINVGNSAVKAENVRNGTRWILDDPVLAAYFFDKIKEFLPNEWDGRELSCLNERLRFLKYETGQYFKPHYDGEYARDDFSERSFVTVQIYLNGGDDDGFGYGLKGGETTFFTKNKDQKRTAVAPAPGKVLIFEHEILHEGSKIKEGVKYVIRTDVMYKRKV